MNPNQFVTTSTQGFGSRILSAIIGVPVGIILIFGSCIMLYWNEGRVDYSKIAGKSVPVQASRVDQSQNGKFVSVTGSLKGQNISDSAYLQPGSYVAVQRTVEEYAWEEDQQTQSHNNAGGSQSNTTTYTYKEAWVDQPTPSGNFKYPQGHQNPAKPLNDTLVRASSATVGAYSFDPQTVKLPSLQNVALTSGNTDLLPTAAAAVPSTPGESATASPLSNLQLASTQYIYGGKGSLGSPQVGDIRISYKALPSGTTATVFGQLNNSGSLGAYTDSSNHTMYDLLLGDRQTAIATLHSQYEKTVWIFRGIGVALIWIGLMMLLAPLDTLLDFIPFVGEIGGVLSAVITLPIALLLGGTVIIIGYTMHHLVALLIGVPVIFAVWVAIFKLIKKARKIPKRGSGGDSAPPQAPAVPTPPPYTPPSPGSGSLFPTNSPAMPTPLGPTETVQPTFQAPVTPQYPSAQPVAPGVVVPQNTNAGPPADGPQMPQQ